MIRRFLVSLTIVLGLLSVVAYAMLNRRMLAPHDTMLHPPIVNVPLWDDMTRTMEIPRPF